MWHRAAGEKNVVVAADDGGAVAVLDTREAVEAYCGALDKRGIREHALHRALQPALSSLPRQSTTASKAEVRAADLAAPGWSVCAHPTPQDLVHCDVNAAGAVVVALRSTAATSIAPGAAGSRCCLRLLFLAATGRIPL